MPLLDLLLLPFVLPAALVMKLIRRAGVQWLPLCRKSLVAVGVFPVRDHFYEPLFNPAHLRRPLSEARSLPGIDLNVEEQLAFLECFACEGELGGIPGSRPESLGFYFNNGSFEAGDAEYWYQVIRKVKPARIVEIGSGNSTLMAVRAISRNREDDSGYRCEHVCIEPFKQPWLEKTGVRIVRKLVEEVDRELFSTLGRGDILFIDSSHIIRPQGDVLLEYLELLPSLKPGVIVHIHDVFTPHDYPEEWVTRDVKLWNEQYLLEAFLTSNREWKILGALNYLHRNHRRLMGAKCPYLTPEHEPGSFYLQKVL